MKTVLLYHVRFRNYVDFCGRGSKCLHRVEIVWKGEGGMHVDILGQKLESHLRKCPAPDIVVIACGTNDQTASKGIALLNTLKDAIQQLKHQLPRCRIMYSNILPRRKYNKAKDSRKVDLKRKMSINT
jgi:lysophospholipase L1-like esterase